MDRLTFRFAAYRFALFALVLPLFPLDVALAEVVDAHRGNSAAMNQRIRATPIKRRLQRLAKKAGLPHYVEHGRLHLAVHPRVKTADYLSLLSPNIVELSMPKQESIHLYTRIGDKTYSRDVELSESDWKRANSERVSVLVRLSDGEMAGLKAHLDKALIDPEATLGCYSGWGGGLISGSNCTSYLVDSPVGRGGKSFAQTLGVWSLWNPLSQLRKQWESRIPNEFINAVIRSASSRVEAVVVHNPEGEFKAGYDLNLSLSIRDNAQAAWLFMPSSWVDTHEKKRRAVRDFFRRP
jgi:hypothetical protein